MPTRERRRWHCSATAFSRRRGLSESGSRRKHVFFAFCRDDDSYRNDGNARATGTTASMDLSAIGRLEALGMELQGWRDSPEAGSHDRNATELGIACSRPTIIRHHQDTGRRPRLSASSDPSAPDYLTRRPALDLLRPKSWNRGTEGLVPLPRRSPCRGRSSPLAPSSSGGQNATELYQDLLCFRSARRCHDNDNGVEAAKNQASPW